MSVNVYIKEDEIIKMSGFKTIEKGGKNGQSWEEYDLSGIKLYFEKGRWYTTLNIRDNTPDLIKDIVEEVSFLEYIPIKPWRESGVYKLGTAIAEIELSGKMCGDTVKKVFIKAENLGDIQEIFHKIKTGSIRPEESFEGEQSGLSRAELEEELERAKESLSIKTQTNGILLSRFKEIEEEAKKSRAEIKNLREIFLRIANESLFACRKEIRRMCNVLNIK